MNKLIVNIKIKEDYSYPIYVDIDLINIAHNIIKDHYSGNQIVIITDKNVAKLYTKNLINNLIQVGYSVLLLDVAVGEKSKSAQTKEKLELEMLKCKINRHALILAVGGGVIGDLAGFVASTYMRGIKIIQIPTTLLSMVDSSVGGKTGINTKFGKNLIGSFYQPQAVIMDLNLLDSLPKEQIINGLVETIKIFLTSYEFGFAYVEANLDAILALDRIALKYIIEKSISLKANIVELDERENNLRMILNFGHTIGHAIEKVSEYKIMHGYAVALGIIIESKISLLMGKLNKLNFDRIIKFLQRLEIDTSLLNNLNLESIALATLNDKKNNDNEIFCVLLKTIGAVELDNDMVATKISSDNILNALHGCVIL